MSRSIVQAPNKAFAKWAALCDVLGFIVSEIRLIRSYF